MSDSRVIALPGNATPDKVRESMRNLQASLPAILEGQMLLAQVTRAKFEALLAQGFSEAQAIELCKGSA